MSELIWAPMAWVDGGHHDNVAVEVQAGVIRSITVGVPHPPGAIAVEGAMVPGLVDAHSHVFHRALRGHPDVGGDFWAWREVMYRLVDRLTPDLFGRLAEATFVEMLAAGITAVGEFHYLHHGPDGRPYDDRHEMTMAVVQAAQRSGIRLCLLDTCYLMSGVDGSRLEGPQRRFGDGDIDDWADRHSDLESRLSSTSVALGSAIHSVRAVPPEAFRLIADTPGPTHVHVSEQPAENTACLEAHGVTPVELLARHGALGPRTTLVHGIHVTTEDLRTIASSSAAVCVCPTTEMDLGDGTADVAAMRTAGIPVSLGSDAHVAIDLLAEARMVEWNDRARYRRRGVHRPSELWRMASVAGADALGFDRWGIEVGAPADMVVIDLERPTTAGIGDCGSLLAAAGSADVVSTIVAGEVVTQAGEHRTLGSAAGRLGTVLRELAT